MNFTEHTKVRKEKFGSVVFDTLTEKIFITDGIGSDILELIEQGKAFDEVVSELCERYDGDKEQISGDVTEFVEQLKTNNIVDSQVVDSQE